ncbi:MAG: prolyl oligopeptidase family serine peptidase [bacterium]
MKHRIYKYLGIFLIVVFIGCSLSAYGQTEVVESYKMPPKAIADLIDAPPTPSVSIGPENKWMLIMDLPALPSIEELARPELRLAGIRFNPKTNASSRSWHYTGLTLKNIKTGKKYSFSGMPEQAHIRHVDWSPDGKYVAFTVLGDDGLRLWLASVNNKTARKLYSGRLNGVYGSPYQWFSDSKTLICRIVDPDRGPAPEEPDIPIAPVIQETTGEKAPARTYQDLLQNPYDEKLFDYYASSQLITVTVKGNSSKIGENGIFRDVSSSPDGQYILVQKIHRPFSYLVPAYRFPYQVLVLDRQGNLVKKIADLPLAENIPIGFDAVPTGPRSFQWRADEPATVVWAEAQDEGDPDKQADIRDKVFMLPAPFTGTPEPIISFQYRSAGIDWKSGELALASEFWWKTRKVRTWLIKPDIADAEPKLLFDRSYEDRYSDPGRPVMTRSSFGTSVLKTDDKGSAVFLRGTGASPEGNFPFLDKLYLSSLKTERLWQCEAPYYEYFIRFLDEKGDRFITRRESKTEPTNYFVRQRNSDKVKRITSFPHPTPQLKNIQQELIKYQRDDGIQLTATLYLPPDYNPDKDGSLPMLMWAYPREYKSAKAAGQVKDSPYRFTRIRWSRPHLWLTQGYAILDGPTMPIIGEGDKEPNDTFIKQLVASAKAAVDEVVRRGIADPERIAIGGHSYGAFMTANLLAHSDLFAAGIARSGAYNRTLTPFGFQSEERTFWEAPEIYFAMSPFMHAHKVNEPILLIHGAADNNSGTFPIQSKRYYHALKGHGVKARLVMLPYESHGYRARESIMHTLWEMTEWLYAYVKKR